jgi:hypothetical protein
MSNDDNVAVPRWLADELVQGQLVEARELIGYQTDDTNDDADDTTTTTSTAGTPSATPVSLDELAAQEAQAEKDGNWQLAFQLKNRRVEAMGYEGKIAPPPPAPAPVPAPELTVDDIRENALKAEQAGRWMEAMSWKNQLLQRGNK